MFRFDESINNVESLLGENMSRRPTRSLNTRENLSFLKEHFLYCERLL
jgi:hypothetical protein